jgi:poly(A) polymerase
MQILGIGPGRDVGRAWAFLKELRLDRGPVGPDVATQELLRWWSENQPSA